MESFGNTKVVVLTEKGKRKELPITKKQFLDKLSAFLNPRAMSGDNSKKFISYEHLREWVSKELGIKPIDFDRVFCYCIYLSRTFSTHLRIVCSHSNKASVILRRSGLEDFDRIIRNRYGLIFGWDTVYAHVPWTEETKAKILEEWQHWVKTGKRKYYDE
jgi:hypothetical protein